MHRIKWIEDNYGISRKAIRNYEEKGLLDKTKNRNPDNNYREYDDEDIDTIRFIKILNGIGYSLDDIKRLSESGAYGFSSLGEKIEKMEKEKDDLEQKINYAKTVKYTGRFLAPSELNTMVVYTMGAESSIYQYLRDLVKEFTTDLPLFAESVTCIF